MKLIYKFSSLLIVASLTLTGIYAQNKQTSVLASGQVYKISVPETGIYKIDYNFLSDINGFNVDNIDPRRIHLYGNMGGPVPQSIQETRSDDLADNSIYIEGEEDGSFDPQDYILFYAEGADRYDFNKNDIEFQKNPYDLNNYFFIKVEEDNGPRIQDVSSLTDSEIVSSTRESIYRHETDRLNLLGNFGGTQGSGKQWFGESFANETVQDFSRSFSFDHVVPNSAAELDIRFAGRNEVTMQYEVTVGNNVNSSTISRTSLDNIEALYAHTKTISEEINLSGPNPTVTVEFTPNGSQAEGWLDYIQIIGRENNIYTDEPLFLIDRNMLEFDSYGFSITNGSSLNVWEITDPLSVTNVQTESLNGNQVFRFNTEDRLRTFVAFDKSGEFLTPSFESQVENQNVHGINAADFIIITHENFREAAERLATHRTEHDGFNVAIVDIKQIYNEFSSGRVDPTAIRDFCKMVHDRDDNFEFLLLLGDASYDYRGLNDQLEFQNFIPTYETDESLHPVEAFPTDDYFGLLSDDEGSDDLDGDLELGIGRIPAQTLDQAMGVINKIINYDTNPETLGDWRMRIGFSADDEDNEIHMKQADGIAQLTELNHPELIQQKVYFDAFNQVSTPGGTRYPDANAAINTNINNGQLVLNYLGHGGPKGWAQERVLQVSDIVNWKNFNKLPVLITATCTFTGFDEPSLVSAGEEAILNSGGGAIALFTTVRAVYSSQNERLTRRVFESIFERNEGQRMRFGDVLKSAQNILVEQNTISNTRKFLLMGDPSMQLALPKHKVVMTELNGIEITQDSLVTIDTLGALERIVLSGNIEDQNGGFLSTFNGNVSLTVFDKSSELKTLNNDNDGRVFNFQSRKNVLYKGSASVIDGFFSMELVIPKDIDFDFGNGLFSFYASDGISEDAAGHYNDIVIGGTSESNIVDNEGPEIDIYFDDRAFLSGDETATNTTLIVDLRDETGINLSSTSIGHDITAHIDNKNESGFVLNDFYQPNVDETGAGTVTYALEDLETGLHTIYIKAWDILNNSSEKTSEFLVVENLEGFVENVINYPNPFAGSTQFAFDHDLNDSNIDITVDIYAMSGVLIKSINAQRFSSDNRIDDIEWDATDFTGGKISKGIYIYKIKVVSDELNLERESDFKKLVLLN
jgi:hypothetical protein